MYGCPEAWHYSYVTNIKKPGKEATDYANGYRPITIMPVLQKIFHSILNTRLLNYALNNKLISEQQIGYLRGRERFEHHIKLIEEAYKHGELVAGFVDFKKHLIV
jgi:hypothetical protein